MSQWGHSDVLRRSARPMRPQESSLSRSTSAVAGRAAKGLPGMKDLTSRTMVAI